ncbi:cation:dicarboxylate symporter family transporter [Bradyrhizobium sp. SZCCHNS2096]|uniref:cation:dicarboxylate symporter family transporter n=1 Tax=Bradyrhizobium sp. SZCCHNS2096 TaxID=3057309 RepID=UPI00291647D8|nr:cation:dicarboxylase symporter family transporter [Bradyrhizobium sp. SZCCHNS2096]
MSAISVEAGTVRQPILGPLWLQVLVGAVIGILFGIAAPKAAADAALLAEGFVKLIRMLLAPVIFLTVVVGIARMGNLREGFVTLAATLATMNTIPLAGIVLLLGVDRFVNPPRALINVIGNSLGTIVVALWENDFDRAKAGDIERQPQARPRAS